MLDQFAEHQAVRNQVAQADVFDLDDPFPDLVIEVGDSIAHNLGRADQAGFQRGRPGIDHGGFRMPQDGLGLAENQFQVLFPTGQPGCVILQGTGRSTGQDKLIVFVLRKRMHPVREGADHRHHGLDLGFPGPGQDGDDRTVRQAGSRQEFLTGL